MRLPFGRWTNFFAAFGRVLRNRRQRKAQEAYRRRRRALTRLHSFDHLEQRVVMNADPVAADDEFYVTQGDYASFTLQDILSNDTDGDEDPLSVTSFDTESANGGRVTRDGDNFTYRHPGGFTGDDTVDYVVDDGLGGWDVGTITFHVADDYANNAPILTPGTQNEPSLSEIYENIPPAANLGTAVADLVDPEEFGDIEWDADGDGLGIAIRGADDTHGHWQYTLDNGSNWSNIGSRSDESALVLAADSGTKVRFLPNAGYHGTSSLSIRLWDGSDSASSGDTVDLSSSTGSSNAYSSDYIDPAITVAAVAGTVALDDIHEDDTDSAGTLVADLTAGIPGGVHGVALIGKDADHGSWEYRLTDNGSWTAVGALSYTPPVNEKVHTHFTGWGKFTFSVAGFDPWYYEDGNEHQPQLDAIFGAGNVFLGDFYNGFSINFTGELAGQDINWSIDDVECDNNDFSCETEVAGSPGSASTLLLAADSQTRIRFVPDADYHGTLDEALSLRWWAGGASNGTAGTTVGGPAFGSETITASLIVLAVNDAPTFTAGEDVEDIDEDSGAYSASWATAVSHGAANESGQTLSFVVTNDNEDLFEEQPEIDASGNLTFKPAANAHGMATVTVKLEDNGGTADGGEDSSNEVEFTITIDSVNDEPSVETSQSPTINEDEPAEFGGTDVDGDELTASIVTHPSHGTLTVDGSVVVYTPDENWSGSTEFQYKLSDGTVDSATATVSLTVRPVNDAPTFTAGGNVGADEDGGEFSQSWATDASVGPGDESGQSLEFIVTTDNPGLFASGPAIDASGNLTFTPAANAHGTATATVRLQDNGGTEYGGHNTTSEIEFTITVHPTNDAPTAEDSSPTIDEDTSVTVGGSDIDGDALTAIVVSEPSHGTATVNSNGTITYVPNLHFNGTDSLQFKVRDPGNAESEVVTVSITVNPIQDPPTATDDTIEVDEDGEVEITRATLLANDGDPDDGDELTITQITSGPAHGTLTETEIGWRYVPDENYYGPDQFSYEITDNHEHTDSATVTINVLPVNDPPSFELDDMPVTAAMNAGETTLADFAFNLSKGTAANEATPTFAFELTSDNPELFTAAGQPTITFNATTEKYDLKFTPQFAGSALVTVKLKDTAPAGENSGIAYSAPQTFWIDVTEPTYQSGGAGSGAPVNPTYDRAEDLWPIGGISVVLDEDTENPLDMAAGLVPVVALDAVFDITVNLTAAVPVGATVEVTWAVDPFSGEGGETDWQVVVTNVAAYTFHKDFSDTEEDRLPSQTATVRVKNGNVVLEERILHFTLDWPEDVDVSVTGDLEFESGAANEILITFADIPEKLQHGVALVGLKSSFGPLAWPYYPNAEGTAPNFDPETGVYTLDTGFPEAPGEYVYVAQYGHAYTEFTVTITPVNRDADVVLSIDTEECFEGDPATVSLNLSDEDLAGDFTVVVNWGDGTIKTYDAEAGHEYAFVHVYRDGDNTYLIEAQVFGAGVSVDEEAYIDVLNVAPSFDYPNIDDGIYYTHVTDASSVENSGMYDVTVEFEGYVYDPGLDDVLTVADEDSGITVMSLEKVYDDGEFLGLWKYTAVYEFESQTEIQGAENFTGEIPGFAVADDHDDTEADYFYQATEPLPDVPTDGRIVSVTGAILDAVAGEPIKLADGTPIADGAVVRFTRSIDYAESQRDENDYVSIDGDGRTYDSTVGETIITFHLEPLAGYEGLAEATDWENVPQTVTIEAGKRFVDLILTAADDTLAEWNEKFQIVIDGWTDRDPQQTDPVTVEQEITLLDNDLEAKLGNNNVDTGVTGLTREYVSTLAGKLISLYDGTSLWVVPFGDGELGALYQGVSNQVVSTVVLPGEESPAGTLDEAGTTERRDVAFASGDNAVLGLTEDITLRRGYGGLADLGNADTIASFDANPTIEGSRFGFVDRLVPVETGGASGVTPLLGFVLMRRDGTNAWYAAAPTGTAAAGDAGEIDEPLDWNPNVRIARWNLDDLESDRFYQLTLPAVEGEARYAGLNSGLFKLVKGSWVTRGAVSDQTAYGASLGFVMPDENGEIEVVYEGDLGFDPPTMSAFDRWTFITPEGSRAASGEDSAEESLAWLTSDGDEEGDVRLTLETKYGDKFEFDGRGLLTAQFDRHGNRSTFDYAPVNPHGTPDGDTPFLQRLTAITRQGDRHIDFTYTADDGKLLHSIAQYAGDDGPENPNRRVTLVSGDTLISPTPDDPSRSLAIHANSGNPLRPGVDRAEFLDDKDLEDADVRSYVEQVGNVNNGEYKLAPTGAIGKLTDAELPEGVEEATAAHRRAYHDAGPNVEATPERTKYQFDRFGLTTAIAAPGVGEQPANRGDVAIWDRIAETGQVEFAYLPVGRGYTTDVEHVQPWLGNFDVTYFRYDVHGNLERIVHNADIEAEDNIGPNSTVETWTYDHGKFHQVDSYIDRTGRETTYVLFDDPEEGEHHTKGDVKTAHVDPDGDGALNLTTEYEYTARPTHVWELAGGLVKKITDPRSVTVYDYHTSGPLTGLVASITYAAGSVDEKTEIFEYDAFGRVQLHQDINGVVTNYYIDVLGQVLETALGPTEQLLVGKQVYDSAGNVVNTIVASPNQPTRDTNDVGVMTIYKYDALNRLIKVIEPASTGQYFVRNEQNEKIGPTTTFTYTADGLIETETRQILTGDPAQPDDPATVETVKTKHEYDDRRRLIKTTVSGKFKNLVNRSNGKALGAPNSAGVPTQDIEVITHYFYDAADNLLGTSDALGRTTNFTYDSDGRLTQTTAPDPDGGGTSNPLGRFITRTEYDAVGRVLREFSPNPSTATGAPAEVYTRYYYDDAGRLIRVQQPELKVPDGAVAHEEEPYFLFTAFEYYADGLLKAERSGTSFIDEPNGMDDLNADGTTKGTGENDTDDDVQKTVAYEYDYLGRKTKTTVTFAGSTVGQLIGTTDYLMVDGKLVVVETSPRFYDDVAVAEDVDEARSYQSVTKYDQFGQIASVQRPDPDGIGAGAEHALHAPLTVYEYFADGSLAKVTQTYIDVQTQFDGLGDPHNRVTSYAYDELGRTRTQTQQGLVVNYSHDSDGNVVEIRHADGSFVKNIYNALGNQIVAERHAADTTARPLQQDLSFYDKLGFVHHQITGYQHVPAEGPGVPEQNYGKWTQYGYDQLDRPVDQLTFNLDFRAEGRQFVIQTTTYNAAGLALTSDARQTATFAANGIDYSVASNTERPITTLAYDAIGRQISSEFDKGNDNIELTETVYYDEARQRTVIDPLGNGTRQTFDALGQQTAEKLLYRPTGGDDLVKLPDAQETTQQSIKYDAAGNVEQTTDRNGRVITYAYDRLNRRVSEVWVGSDPAYEATFAYDDYGALISATDAASEYVLGYDSRGLNESAQFTAKSPHAATEFEVFNYVAKYDHFHRPLSTSIERGDTNEGIKIVTAYDSWGRLTKLEDHTVEIAGGTLTDGLSPMKIESKYDQEGYYNGSFDSTYYQGAVPALNVNTEFSEGRRVKVEYANSAAEFNFYQINTVNELGLVQVRAWSYDAEDETYQHFQYDGRGQITAVGASESGPWTELPTYDAGGNRKDADVGPHNRIERTWIAESTGGGAGYGYKYDLEGNRTTEFRFGDIDVVTEVEYDDEAVWKNTFADNPFSSNARYNDDETETDELATYAPFDSGEIPAAQTIRFFVSLPTPSTKPATAAAQYWLTYRDPANDWHDIHTTIDQRDKGDYRIGNQSWHFLFELTVEADTDLGTLSIEVNNANPDSGALVIDALRVETATEETTYEYDYRNRLVKVAQRTMPEEAYPEGSPQFAVEYRYDVFNRRIETATYSDDPTAYEYYVFNGDNRALVYRQVEGYAALAERRYYVGTDRLVAVEFVDDEQLLWVLTNQQGSVLGLFGKRPDSGEYALFESRTYDGKGEVTIEPTAGLAYGVVLDVGFQGREKDPNTDLLDFRSRWYSVYVGAFIAEDGIGISDDLNRYRFERNSNPNATDPDGHVIPLPLIIFAIGASVIATGYGITTYHNGQYQEAIAAGDYAEAEYHRRWAEIGVTTQVIGTAIALYPVASLAFAGVGAIAGVVGQIGLAGSLITEGISQTWDEGSQLANEWDELQTFDKVNRSVRIAAPWAVAAPGIYKGGKSLAKYWRSSRALTAPAPRNAPNPQSPKYDTVLEQMRLENKYVQMQNVGGRIRPVSDSTVPNLRDAALEVHNAARIDPIRFQKSTVVVQAVQTAGGPELRVASSSGYLTAAQRSVASKLGLVEKTFSHPRGAPRLHAERILDSHLQPGESVIGWGISWKKDQIPLPCSECNPLVHQRGGWIDFFGTNEGW